MKQFPKETFKEISFSELKNAFYNLENIWIPKETFRWKVESILGEKDEKIFSKKDFENIKNSLQESHNIDISLPSNEANSSENRKNFINSQIEKYFKYHSETEREIIFEIFQLKQDEDFINFFNNYCSQSDFSLPDEGAFLEIKNFLNTEEEKEKFRELFMENQNFQRQVFWMFRDLRHIDKAIPRNLEDFILAIQWQLDDHPSLLEFIGDRWADSLFFSKIPTLKPGVKY